MDETRRDAFPTENVEVDEESNGGLQALKTLFNACGHNVKFVTKKIGYDQNGKDVLAYQIEFKIEL